MGGYLCYHTRNSNSCSCFEVQSYQWGPHECLSSLQLCCDFTLVFYCSLLSKALVSEYLRLGGTDCPRHNKLPCSHIFVHPLCGQAICDNTFSAENLERSSEKVVCSSGSHNSDAFDWNMYRYSLL